LCISNAALMIPAVILLEADRPFAAYLVAAGLPALRIALRHRGHRGYYLLGYNDGPGGDATRHAQWISRFRRPQWFGLMVVVETGIVLLLLVSLIAHP
jgi:hypothetical protein